MSQNERETGTEADHAPAEAEDAAGEVTTQHGDHDGAEASERDLGPETSQGERRRAAEAEHELSELRERYERTEKALEETRRELAATERRQRIDQLLMEAETVDLEAARLLTEAAVEQMDEADVRSAVEELRRRKPHLFRQPGGAERGAMAGRARGGVSGGAGRRADEAAETAAMSGDRRDLLRYLRLRRRGRKR